MINLFQPSVGEDELDAVREVFASNWLGVGDRTTRFETAFGNFVGCRADQLVAVASCSEGLSHAVAALGIGSGDEVVLPTASFVGAAHAVLHSGARVRFCDIDPWTLNPSVAHIAAAATPATKAVMVLHYGGYPGDLAAIAEYARERSLLLIEDAAISLGSSVDGRACGTFGAAGVWSFDTLKLLTTVDGGMVWTKNPAVADRLRSSIRLGVSTGFSRRADEPHWWEIEPAVVGRRATMNNVAAAIGLVQIGRVPAFMEHRRAVAAAYDHAFAALPWLRRPPAAGSDIVPSFYWVQADHAVRNRLAIHLRESGIYTSFKYWPLHLTRLYGDGKSYPGAERAAATTLLLPLHQGLNDAEVATVIESVSLFRP